MAKISQILLQADIFQGLKKEHLELIQSCSYSKEYEFGENIFKENTASDELYVITDGEVEIMVDPTLISKSSSDPVHPSTIATLRRGQCFGEIALVDQGIRTASAMSASPKTVLLILPRKDLMEICEQNTDLGYRLMYNLAADLALKIRSTDLRLREHLLYGRPRGS